MRILNRRQFLKKSQVGILGITGLMTGIMGSKFGLSQGTLNYEKITVPTKDNVDQVKRLRAQKISWEIARNRPTQLWGFLKNTFAPPLVVSQDETFDLTLSNQLAMETIGLHWHGIRVPNSMDGVPYLTQSPITLGESYRYRFTSPDAGTYWYHTHSHSLMQLRMGLVGPLIIREKKPYPVDEDLILLMNDWSLDRNMQMDRRLLRNDFLSMPTAAHDGLLGNVVTVNGKVNPTLRVAPRSRLRLRFINAATARIFYVNIPRNLNPHFLAVDGQPVPVEPYRKIVLAPGMRMDIIADMPSDVFLKKTGEIQINDNAYRNKEYLFRLVGDGKPIRSQSLSKINPLPNNPIPKIRGDKARKIRVSLQGGAMSGMMRGGMGGMIRGMMSGLFWSINGVAMPEKGHYDKPIFKVKKDRHVILELENITAFSHPIHLHGHTFFILSRNGIKAKNPRSSDTIFMNPNEKAEIGFVADNPGKWMFHCHIIDHQVSGMMGFFEVG